MGSHFGGYTPFEFDVAGKLNYGGTNTVVVCADNTYHRGAWWPWGGISRSVELIANNDARIVWQHVRTEPDLTAGTARVFVRYLLHNAGATPRELQLSASITYPDSPQPVVTQEAKASVPAMGDATADIALDVPAGVHLWDFDHPHLYTLTTTLRDQGQLVHVATDRFGVRKIQVTPDGLSA